MSDTAIKTTLPGQISRFAVIGLIASALHVTVAGGFYYEVHFHPLIANFTGFVFAWIVSFAGHYFWTFDRVSTMRRAMPRFLLVSLFGLLLNQVIVWLVVSFLGQSFTLAMALVVVIIPATSFIISKLWAFRAEGRVGVKAP